MVLALIFLLSPELEPLLAYVVAVFWYDLMEHCEALADANQAHVLLTYHELPWGQPRKAVLRNVMPLGLRRHQSRR